MPDSHPELSPDVLENALRSMPAPVAIVGATNGSLAGGLTAAWVTRVSLDPALLLVAVGHSRFTWELMRDATHFTISLPTEQQVSVARLFGLTSRREVDKWAEVDHVLLGDQVPALKHCTARFLCRKTDVLRTGDHDCFVGQVVLAEKVSDQPALPLRGPDFAPAAE